MSIEELKMLAEAATPGPWSESDGYAGVVAGKQFIAQAYGDRRADCINNAAYIAAANPAAVLELIAEIERLNAEITGG